jgi:hypothetical protein
MQNALLRHNVALGKQAQLKQLRPPHKILASKTRRRDAGKGKETAALISSSVPCALTDESSVEFVPVVFVGMGDGLAVGTQVGAQVGASVGNQVGACVGGNVPSCV